MKKEKIIEKIGEEWYDMIGEEFNKDYMSKLAKGISDARKIKTIYPSQDKVFRAFKETPFSKVKVILLGQDPYHDGNADGLAFSCAKRVTPSMRKIQELYDREFPASFATDIIDGKLDRWAKEGVFLLNVSLTVPKGDPGKHLEHWKPFTKEVIAQLILDDKTPKVFVLLGKFAQNLLDAVVREKLPCFIGAYGHTRLSYEHPAYAARKGRPWNAEGMFESINNILIQQKLTPINW